MELSIYGNQVVDIQHILKNNYHLRQSGTISINMTETAMTNLNTRNLRYDSHH